MRYACGIENRSENTQNNINQPEGLPFVTGGHCPVSKVFLVPICVRGRRKKKTYIIYCHAVLVPVTVLRHTMVPVLN